MGGIENESPVRLDLNNPTFQDGLFQLQKPERLAALDTLRKIRQLPWPQLYRDKGLRWEKIQSVNPRRALAHCIRCASHRPAAAPLTATAIFCAF